MLTAVFFSMTACAETPNAVVPNDDVRNVEQVTTEDITAHALKYTGSDSLGRSCNLYVTVLEDHDHDHKSGDEGHHLLMKLDYETMDGHKPHAGESEFYQYNAATGVYFGEDEDSPETKLVLLSMSLKEVKEELDPNMLNQYIANAELEQFIRIEFASGSEAHDYVEALELALEGDHSSVDLTPFKNINKINMGLAHGDHYHFPTCSIQNPVAIEETTFEMDGHDHDHDHDHM
jgi:choline dehydrogenase-like flavoprotein